MLDRRYLQSSYVDRDVIGGKIVQDIPLSLVSKGEEAGQSHHQACDH